MNWERLGAALLSLNVIVNVRTILTVRVRVSGSTAAAPAASLL